MIKNIQTPKLDSSLIMKGYNQRKLKKALLLDKLLKLIIHPKPSQALPSSFSNILVIQSHLIGDLIMAIPLLKALKKWYPNAKIILLAGEFSKELMEELPFIDEIVTMKFPWSTYDYSLKNIGRIFKVLMKLRERKIDLAIDAQIDMRNAFLMFLIGAKRRLGYSITGGSSFLTDIPEFPKYISNLMEARLSILSYLNIDYNEKSTSLPLNQEALVRAQNFLNTYHINDKKLIAIHPGASKKEKLWPAISYVKVIQYLLDIEMHPVLIEGPNDRNIIRQIQNNIGISLTCFKGNLKEVAAFISRCRLLLCLDSAAIHLASAVKTPVVAIYGPQFPWLTKPHGPNIEILWNENLDCRPCEYGKCKYKTNICMESITPDQVIEKIDRLLFKNDL